MVAMVRVFAVAAAICFSVITSDAAQLSISGTYKVTGVNNLTGTGPFPLNLGDTGQWTLDLAWPNTGVSTTSSFGNVNLTMFGLGGQTYEYTALKADPVPTLSTGALGQNQFVKFNNFSFQPASNPVNGVIGNSGAVLKYEALTDANVSGTTLTEARVNEILSKAFQSEGTFDLVTVGTGFISLANIELYGPTVVPEPGTVGLFGLLAGGFGVVAWRRRRSL